MSKSFGDTPTRLHRDTLSTPWGFRMQGGADFKAPLTVQRVFVGSPADGTLSRGDVITAIENYDASRMIHKQAMDIVKQAGGSLTLCIRRSAAPAKVQQAPKIQSPPSNLPYRTRPTEALTPLAPQKTSRIPEFGTDYTKVRKQMQPSYSQQASHHGLGYQSQGPPQTMLERLNRTLSSSLWNQEEGDQDYEYQPVGDLRNRFNQNRGTSPEGPRKPVKELKQKYSEIDRRAQTLPRMRCRTQPQPVSSVGAGPVWQRPEPILSRPPRDLIEPGWAPQALSPPAGWRPVNSPHYAEPQRSPRPPPPAPAPLTIPAPAPVARPDPVPVNRSRPVERKQPKPYIQHIKPEGPAWIGSLKSSGGPKPWEMREAEVISGGGPSGIPPAPQQTVVHQPRVQTVTYGPGASAPVYGQKEAAAHGPSDTAQVKHLQYNTPIGLYSKDNVQEVLTGQTAGKPGEGTLQVSTSGPGFVRKAFDPDRSDVLRLLQEEETIKQRGYGLRPQGSPAAQSARYVEQEGEVNYQGYVDQSQRSPALARLEQNLAHGQVDAQNQNGGGGVHDAAPPLGEGASDF